MSASCPVAARDNDVFLDIAGIKRPKAPKAADAVARTTCQARKDCHWSAICTRSKRPSVSISFWRSWAAQYGTTYQFRIGGTRVVATSDPAPFDEALRARPETFRRTSKTDLILTEIGIKGVFNAEGEAWRPQRKLSVAALAQRNLRSFIRASGSSPSG